MIKKVLLIILALSLFVCLAGCGDHEHDHDHNDIFSESNTLLIIEKVNHEVSDENDYWIGSVQTVDYSGNVEYFDKYSESGEKNHDTWSIGEKGVENAYNYLYSMRKHESEQNLEGGVQYVLKFCNFAGETTLEFYGYDNDEILKSIHEIVGPWATE